MMTHSKDMRQLAKEKLHSAQNAHDILDALWEGAWAKRKSDEEHPPTMPPTADLVQFLLSANIADLNKLPFKQTPTYAVFDTTSNNKHFAYEAYARLGKCFDAIALKFVVEPLNLEIEQEKEYSPSKAPPQTILVEYLDNQIVIIKSLSQSESDLFNTSLFTCSTAFMSQLLNCQTFEEHKEFHKKLKDRFPQLETYPQLETEAEFNKKQILKAQEAIERTHEFWVRYIKTNNSLKHPLVPIIEAWQQDTTAKRISKAYDQRHPVAVIKGKMGSVKYISEITDNNAMNRLAPLPPDEGEQLHFGFAKDPESVLPPYLSLNIVPMDGVPYQTRDGGLAMPYRIFREFIMALTPSETKATLLVTLGELIDYLYPPEHRGKTVKKAYYKMKVADGLRRLFDATIQYTEWNGSTGLWILVRPKNLPDRSSSYDFPIYADVELPRDATQGYMIVKDISRQLSMKTAGGFHAYDAACYLFDRYATRDGKLVYTTRPDPNKIKRNDRDELLDANGKVYRSKNGKPIKSIYHTDVVHKLERVPSEEGLKKYPVIHKRDLIRACYPAGHNLTEKETWKRAKAFWHKLESYNIIEIDKVTSVSWRILPSNQTLANHNALRKAIEKSQKDW